MESMPLKMWGFRFIVPEVHFHAELMGTSCIRIAHKTAKFFKFLQGPTQCERTIVESVSLAMVPKLVCSGSNRVVGP